MLATIETLRDISRRCLAAEPLSAEQSRWLGSSLERFLHHEAGSVDDALGLRFPQGGVPWWREEAIRDRNRALRELAERFYGDLSPYAQAQRIWTLATRYAAAAWRYDRDRGAPESYQGSHKQYLYEAFASGATMPVCRRQLRTILGR